jgi:hypothetical protein
VVYTVLAKDILTSTCRDKKKDDKKKSDKKGDKKASTTA